MANCSDMSNLTALDFFAGSGLVTYSLKPYFNVVWANDISPQKAIVYQNNHQADHFKLADIKQINGSDLPKVDLSWASFPCQDLSLAGNGKGIYAERSGLVWQWLRIMDEMQEKPGILTAENVEGLLSANQGQNYITLHNELVRRGYRVGAVKLDAIKWLPQSRPRIFVIAVKDDAHIPEELLEREAGWQHTQAMRVIASQVDNWLWWRLPKPEKRTKQLSDLIEWNARVDSEERTAYLLSLLSDKHKKMLDDAESVVAPGYKRTRNGQQRLELRFDGVAGCLRTPKGGSSRQTLVLKTDGHISTRLLTARETARLMGAPDDYWLPSLYNDAYMAMGDAVAVPVVNFLAKHLLAPLAKEINKQHQEQRKGANNDVAC